MKRYIPVLLAALMCFTFFACSRTEEQYEEPETTAVELTEPTVIEKNITLGYYEDKALNPFTTDSPANRNLTTLIYDSLYILDKSYSPVAVIAESSQREGNTVSVKIREGLIFSNGAPITTYDVANSFDAAKQSTYYGSRLQNIAYATPLSDRVVFTLIQEDIYCESVLTFPVVQSGTAGTELPVGSGRYTLTVTDEGKQLIANPDNSRGQSLSTETILLTPVTSQKNELYELQSGGLSYFFDDLSDSDYTKIGANTVQVPMNNLVFVGINSFSEVFTDAAVKNAVTTAINSKTMADSVFSGMCRYAATPFNPDWYAAQHLSFEPDAASLTAAQELLEEAGYVYAYENNQYRSKDFEYLVITLIVNKESTDKVNCASYIHDTLEAAGVDVELKLLSYDEYISALKAGKYDLYVGEVKLSASMDLSCFFSEGGSLSYGIDTQSTVAASYMDFRSGTTDISTFARVFEQTKPFIPVCYRDGMAYFSREFTFEGDITEYEPFLNASTWKTVR